MRARLWLPEGESRAETLARSSPDLKRAFLSSLSPAERNSVLAGWPFWARPKQLPPPSIDFQIQNCPIWQYWLVLAGRMWGKSRTAAQWIHDRVESGQARRIVLAAPTYQDVEKIMIPAIQRTFPDARRPKYIRSNLELRFWPYHDDSPVAEVRTSDKPDGFRGREWDCGWIDEFASFDNIDDCWMWLVPAMRAIPPKGGVPQLIITTTPRNKKVLHDLLENPRTVLTQGHSHENQKNVADGTLEAVNFIYQGTDLEDQELGGKLLGNEPGALFHQPWFNANRESTPLKFKRKIVAVDTSGSGKDSACECGIVVLGLSEDGKTAYMLEDASLRATPEVWAKKMFEVHQRWKADQIIYEKNYGGELIPTMFRQMGMPAHIFKPIPAVGTKAQRAQPVSALVQGGKVKFVGQFRDFEMQCTTWTPKDRKSPDRMDAFVHGVTELFPAIGRVDGRIIFPGMW